MPKTKEQKEEIIKKIEDHIKKQKIMLFVAIAGLKTKDILGLKKKLKEKDCLLAVAKKTLIRLAAKKQKIELDTKKMEGELALVFGFSDEISAAKIVKEFAATNKNLNILGGFFENNLITKDNVIVLANTLSRQDILSKLVGTLSAPSASFVRVLEGNIKGLVRLLSKIKQ